MSASHEFPSRDGVGVVRARMPNAAPSMTVHGYTRRTATGMKVIVRQFDDAEDAAILAMRKNEATHAAIALALGRSESSIQMRLKLLTKPEMRPAVEGPFSAAEDKIIVKMRGLGESRKAIAAELGRSCAAVKSRIAHLTAPRQRKAEFQRPDVAAKKTATTIERRCLNCQKRFDAPTRFIRLCDTHRRGDGH